jgi:hypothetical protein
MRVKVFNCTNVTSSTAHATLTREGNWIGSDAAGGAPVINMTVSGRCYGGLASYYGSASVIIRDIRGGTGAGTFPGPANSINCPFAAPESQTDAPTPDLWVDEGGEYLEYDIYTN